MQDESGTSALETRSNFLDVLSDIPRLDEADPLSRVDAHLEVHIEQRMGLKAEGASVGIVTAVAGPARYRLRFSGESGHAGEARMHERHDALCAAAEAILVVERLARKAASTVATVGTVRVEPNALTAVPGMVELGLDVRSTDLDEAEELTSLIMERAREISGGRGVDLSVHRLSSSAPAGLDKEVAKLAEEVASKEGIPALRCVSYAGHDAQHLAERVPAALLFAASSNGVSHAPEEAIDEEDLRNAYRMVTALLPELYRNYEGG